MMPPPYDDAESYWKFSNESMAWVVVKRKEIRYAQTRGRNDCEREAASSACLPREHHVMHFARSLPLPAWDRAACSEAQIFRSPPCRGVTDDQSQRLLSMYVGYLLTYQTGELINMSQFADGLAYSKGKLEDAFKTGGILDKPFKTPKETISVKREDVDIIVR